MIYVKVEVHCTWNEAWNSWRPFQNNQAENLFYKVPGIDLKLRAFCSQNKKWIFLSPKDATHLFPKSTDWLIIQIEKLQFILTQSQKPKNVPSIFLLKILIIYFEFISWSHLSKILNFCWNWKFELDWVFFRVFENIKWEEKVMDRYIDCVIQLSEVDTTWSHLLA